MLSSTFGFLIDIIFRIPFGCEYYSVFNLFILPFSDSMKLCFHCFGEFLLRSKNRAVFTLIKQLHAGAVIKKCSNRCSSNVSPIGVRQMFSNYCNGTLNIVNLVNKLEILMNLSQIYIT